MLVLITFGLYKRDKRGTSTAFNKHPQPEAKSTTGAKEVSIFLNIFSRFKRIFLNLSIKSARHTKGKSVGPDRFRRIPSAEKFKKIGQRLMLASAILASSASSSDAQSTPKSEPLSNQVSEKQLIVTPQALESDAGVFDQSSVKLSNLENSHVEVNLAEIPSIKEEKKMSNNESTKIPLADNEISLITGYYCKYIPGYIIGDGGGYCGLTAMGIPVEPGIAACGIEYPLGSYIDVEGFGRFLCADRGHLSPSQIDIFFETNEQLENSNKPDFAKVTLINNP